MENRLLTKKERAIFGIHISSIFGTLGFIYFFMHSFLEYTPLYERLTYLGIAAICFITLIKTKQDFA